MTSKNQDAVEEIPPGSFQASVVPTEGSRAVCSGNSVWKGPWLPGAGAGATHGGVLGSGSIGRIPLHNYLPGPDMEMDASDKLGAISWVCLCTGPPGAVWPVGEQC